jgi:hypothetical protein
MNLSDYFESAEGLGILATADSQGKVDVAIYARPHVIGETTIAFIMAEHLTHQNVQSNPQAAYLFVQKGKGYAGKRLYLTKIREDSDPKAIDALRRRQPKGCPQKALKEYLVFFRIDRIRPLVGEGDK